MLCSYTVSDFSDSCILNWDSNGIFSTKATFVSNSPAGQELPVKTHLGFYFSNVCNIFNSWVSLLTWNTLSLDRLMSILVDMKHTEFRVIKINNSLAFKYFFQTILPKLMSWSWLELYQLLKASSRMFLWNC